MSVILALPVFLPLGATALAVLVRGQPSLQRAVALAGAIGLLASAVACLVKSTCDGTFALQMGGWAPPFAICFVADTLSSTMAVITGLIGVASVTYGYASDDLAPARAGFFLPLLLLMLAGVAGAFLTGDLFNLYVWFELMLVASFGLLVIGDRAAQLEGTLKYVVLNVLATTLLLLAVALTYGVAGTLSLADLTTRMPTTEHGALPTAIASLFVIAFGIKAAAFPLYSWLPSSYPTTSFAVSGALAGLLTKVGVYGLYRVLIFVFPTQLEIMAPALGALASLTMLSGVLGAVASSDVRVILSFHIVSQVGYMLLPLAMVDSAALAAGVFYVVHHIIVKSSLFFVSGLAARASGSSELAPGRGGLVHTHGLIALLFAIPAASLAGVPPLSGFWAKLMIVSAALDEGRGVLVAVALLTSLLTLYSMTKIWQAVFWGDARSDERERTREDEAPAPRLAIWSYTPLAVLTLVTASIGLWPEPLVQLAERVATQMLHREEYVAAVLGADR